MPQAEENLFCWFGLVAHTPPERDQSFLPKRVEGSVAKLQEEGLSFFS